METLFPWPQYGHRVRRDLAALVAEFAANNVADAVGRGDLVTKFAVTGGTGRRVRGENGRAWRRERVSVWEVAGALQKRSQSSR